LAEVRRRLAAFVEGTPGTMRLLGTFAVLGTLVFGVLGFVAVGWEASSLSAERSDAAQLVRLQRIHTNLVQADANATNAFLVGGLEPAGSRTAYENGIALASTTLADAAAHDPGDAAALGEINDALSRYTGLVESARANNRQGFPVGVAYVKQASNLLHDTMLPKLVTLVESAQQRVSDAYSSSSSASAGLWIGALLALSATISVAGWLASKTRRTVNVPLSVATVLIAVTFVGGGLVVYSSQHRAARVRDHAYAATVSLASARIAAFDAKSAESLSLISRGSGQDFEARFQTQTNTARSQALAADQIDDSTGVTQALDAYLAVHVKVRAADDGGQHDQAVAIATGSSTDATTSNGTFQAFDDASSHALEATSKAISDDLSSARTALPIVRWLVLAVAIGAAAGAWQGMASRLREYR
jgi:hypothetical protein